MHGRGECAWQGACMAGACVAGGVHGRGGMCGMCAGGLHRRGDVHGGGACVVDTMRYGDTVNDWVVCILLECILVVFVSL